MVISQASTAMSLFVCQQTLNYGLAVGMACFDIRYTPFQFCELLYQNATHVRPIEKTFSLISESLPADEVATLVRFIQSVIETCIGAF